MTSRIETMDETEEPAATAGAATPHGIRTTPRPWHHGPLFWEGWAETPDGGVRVFEVPHAYPDGGHQPDVYVDPAIGRTREADAALIVAAVNDYDRLRWIEAAARVVCDPMVADGGGDRWWKAHDELRSALTSSTPEKP